MRSDFAVSLIATLQILSSPAASSPRAHNGPCTAVQFDVTTDDELVELYGPPCSVRLRWDVYKGIQSSRPRDVSFIYAYCAVPCGPTALDEFALCHTVSWEALEGPLGVASLATFTIRDGRVSSIDWDYSLEKAPLAKSALAVTPDVEFHQGAGAPLSASWTSPTCDLSASEQPERSIRVYAHKPGPSE